MCVDESTRPKIPISRLIDRDDDDYYSNDDDDDDEENGEAIDEVEEENEGEGKEEEAVEVEVEEEEEEEEEEEANNDEYLDEDVDERCWECLDERVAKVLRRVVSNDTEDDGATQDDDFLAVLGDSRTVTSLVKWLGVFLGGSPAAASGGGRQSAAA